MDVRRIVCILSYRKRDLPCRFAYRVGPRSEARHVPSWRTQRASSANEPPVPHIIVSRLNFNAS
jgi:hypothetical protein